MARANAVSNGQSTRGDRRVETSVRALARGCVTSLRKVSFSYCPCRADIEYVAVDPLQWVGGVKRQRARDHLV